MEVKFAAAAQNNSLPPPRPGEPQVVDEVAVPSVPTGEDKAQLLRAGVGQMPLTCHVFQAGQRGGGLGAGRLPRHPHLVPTPHVFWRCDDFHPAIAGEGALLSPSTYGGSRLELRHRHRLPLPVSGGFGTGCQPGSRESANCRCASVPACPVAQGPNVPHRMGSCASSA
ncbi:hypothetical protein AAFF_G00226370 [Aldrovandia affinis]|uniref:Uncharacterized protein n=1 Tax=Aldrovandia affinis TaxID=143900 RepID=A0AAD7X396_9TELE|nr:hypothetical protein AAFF_G00226370 [Aldrovandia affinis]